MNDLPSNESNVLKRELEVRLESESTPETEALHEDSCLSADQERFGCVIIHSENHPGAVESPIIEADADAETDMAHLAAIAEHEPVHAAPEETANESETDVLAEAQPHPESIAAPSIEPANQEPEIEAVEVEIVEAEHHSVAVEFPIIEAGDAAESDAARLPAIAEHAPVHATPEVPVMESETDVLAEAQPCPESITVPAIEPDIEAAAVEIIEAENPPVAVEAPIIETNAAAETGAAHLPEIAEHEPVHPVPEEPPIAESEAEVLTEEQPHPESITAPSIEPANHEPEIEAVEVEISEAESPIAVTEVPIVDAQASVEADATHLPEQSINELEHPEPQETFTEPEISVHTEELPQPELIPAPSIESLIHHLETIERSAAEEQAGNEFLAPEKVILAEATSIDLNDEPSVASQGTKPGLMADSGQRGIIARIRGLNTLFLYTVVIPTILSAIYYGFIASDIYISESRLVVRSPQRQTPTGLGALLQGAGFSRAQDDTYSVHDFILSRDAMHKLDQEFHLKEAFGDKNIDILSRFAGLDWWDDSFEALHRYYQKRVGVEVDNQSSIATVKVSAFSAEDAYRINEKLIEMSEDLVNELNERGRQDLIHFASTEVEAAEKKVKAAALALSQYRNQKSVFDPEKQSPLQLQLISKLQDELIATKTQLTQVRTLTRDNPQIASLQKRMQSLQEAIDAETSKVAGGDRSLSNKAAEFERLALEREFAEKQLAGAMTSLELARNEAQRKQLYLGLIAQPSMPDFAVEPRRLRSVFATFVLGLIAWGILTILIAGVREHHD